MAHKSTFLTKFRRRRENKTDYKKRITMLKSGLPRLVARRYLRNFSVQLITNGKNGDITIASAFSKELSGFEWKAHCGNLPAAYLTGLLAGLRAKEKKIEAATLDIGLVSPKHGSGVFAALKGALDAGLKIAHDEKALPKQERIEGKHIEEFAKKLDEAALKKQFSACLKAGVDPRHMSAYFAKAKESVLQNFSVAKKQKGKGA